MSSVSPYGLTIEVKHEGETSDRGADVVWQQHRVESLPPPGAVPIRPLHKADGLYTEHIFAAGGRTYAAFDVSPDGRNVSSRAVPSMLAGNLQELFSETVMRTVLCRLNLPAFHASAVHAKGRAVLIVGAKGAGKSTLSSALQRTGWDLLADDLVRLRLESGLWCALPGMQRSKLRPDSLHALGYSPEHTERRWKGAMPEGAEGMTEEKFLVSSATGGSATAGVPVLGTISLLPRESGTAHPFLRQLPARGALLELAQHLIRDPLPPFAPPPAAGPLLGDLVSGTRVWQLQLGDDLGQLQRSAEEVAAELQRWSGLANP